ncbi:UNVERIFIED_CONTAM: hypothetical protein GTU68_053210 [Idotea baltica]|nr:hypothetical protein [Idotea baltica]
MRMTPDRRVMALKKFNSDLFGNEKVKKELDQWGLKLEPNMAQIQGRVLPEELITQGGKSFNYQQNTADWSREMRNLRLNTPLNLTNWACIYPGRFSNDARELVSTLQRVGSPMGMSVGNPTMITLNGDSPQEYIRSLNSCAGKQMVLILLPNNRADRYSSIKKHVSVNLGIPSQCVLTRTLMKKQRLMSVGTKIAIQMNCKLGGDVWNLNIPLKNVMVIGYDAYHDSVTKAHSYGATVSSMNHNWTKYYGQVARHTNKEELTDNFSVAVKRALEGYMKENNVLPSTVIVFRDGVGEGQIGYVKEHEIAAIRACFQRVYQTPPKFAFVIVSKRINTRLFSYDAQNRVGNPPPGTVVDTEITLPERYDFFLVSQSVNQGTVSPTSFNVIEDDTGLKPDHMHRIAYKLTHLYYNWQGTVRVPAPCLYAHKLAFLTGTAIHDIAHPSLADKLWYL